MKLAKVTGRMVRARLQQAAIPLRRLGPGMAEASRMKRLVRQAAIGIGLDRQEFPYRHHQRNWSGPWQGPVRAELVSDQQ